MGRVMGKDMRIQLNDKFATADEVADYVSVEKAHMSPEDQQQMMVSIKADKHTPLGLVNQVKQSLRSAKVLRISYSAVERKSGK